MDAYEILDEALDSLADAGPDLRNGMTSHAPMAAEALCALGRPDAVMPWLERQRAELLPWPAPRARIDAAGFAAALGRPERASDWRAHFAAELEGAPWRAVLDRAVARLAPALFAAATHGVIRTGHAARALALAETPARRRELADALASWASTWQTLPTDATPRAPALPPAEAITRVPVVPPAGRRFTGTIVSSLEALDAFPPFASAIALADLDGDPAARISDLTETFARVYLANARDPLHAIVFVHGVTSVASLRSLAPALAPATTRQALCYAWQAACGLYSAFGDAPAPAAPVEPPRESREALIDRAVASGDDHAIKFTEACLREHAERPSAVYLAAARHALDAMRA
jgi:hypothetical protein